MSKERDEMYTNERKRKKKSLISREKGDKVRSKDVKKMGRKVNGRKQRYTITGKGRRRSIRKRGNVNKGEGYWENGKINRVHMADGRAGNRESEGNG